MEPEVSVETSAEIFSVEAAMLRRKVWTNGGVAIAALIFWAVIDRRWGSPIFMLAGYMTVPTWIALFGWWQHRRSGEAAVVGRSDERRAAIDEQVALNERLHTRGMPVTLSLVALVVIVGVLQLVLSGTLARSVEAAALVKTAVTGGQWWRLISATFLHLSVMHLIGNMAALFMLGRLVEGYSPRSRLPLVYGVAGVTGSIASYLFLSATSAGASGAIMGVAGYLAAISYLDPPALPRAVRVQVFTIVGLNLYLGAFGFGFIDNAAHVGGMVAGAALAWWCVKRGDVDAALLNALGRVAIVCVLLGASGTVYVLQRHGHRRDVVKPVASVSATLTGTRSSLSVMLRNDSDQPLEAYSLEVISGRTTVETAWRDDCCFELLSGGSPVPPHATREVRLSPMFVGLTVAPPTAEIGLAIFADGSWEGRASQYATMVKQREWVADDADYWLKALGEDRALPLAGWHNSLVTRMEAREKLSTFGRPSASVFGIPRLASLVGTPPARFESEINARVTGITVARDELRRRLAKR